MGTPRLRLGQLLVDARMISQEDLDNVLAHQRTDSRRLGTLLVERGHINETQLTQILSHQLAVPWVSLLHIEFSRQLLNLVPREVAELYCLVPIYVRHVRNQGETLYVAMDDPTNEDGLKACNLYSGLPVRAMIAPPSDIRNAIRVYYGGTARSVAPPAITEPPPRETDPAPLEGPEIAVTEDEIDAPESRPTVVGEPPEDEGARVTLESIPSDELLEKAAVEPRAETRPFDPDFLDAASAKADEILQAQRDTDAVNDEPTIEDAAAEQTAAAADAVAAAAADAGTDAASATDAAEADSGQPGHRRRVAALLGAVLGRGREDTPPADAAQIPASAPEHTPPDDEASHEEAPIERDVESIPQPKGRGPRMVALTLLDGTTIALPARGKPAHSAAPADLDLEGRPSPPSEPEAHGLTARDLIAALRAVSHGADASEVLGSDIRWETVFAALLSLMLKKQLIADWEFVEELEKL